MNIYYRVFSDVEWYVELLENFLLFEGQYFVDNFKDFFSEICDMYFIIRLEFIEI